MALVPKCLLPPALEHDSGFPLSSWGVREQRARRYLHSDGVAAQITQQFHIEPCQTGHKVIVSQRYLLGPVCKESTFFSCSLCLGHNKQSRSVIEIHLNDTMQSIPHW